MKMKMTPAGKHAEPIFLLLLLFSTMFFFLWNLSNHYLWQDEAQTALISKTVAAEGVPRGYDGRNFFSQESGAEYGENYIWKWHTWLPFYVLAGFFKIFGVNTFVARLPFALFGIGTVFLAYFFSKAMWQSKKIAAMTALLLLISVPFLLLSRQCRYYSMSAFFSLAGLYAYMGLADKKKYSGFIFVLSATLLFHTHYIYCATLLGTVGLHSLIFHRRRLGAIVLWCVVIVLINAPWIVWLSGMKYGDQYSRILFDTTKLSLCVREYLRLVGLYILTPYLLLVIPFAALGSWTRNKRSFSPDRQFRQKLTLLVFFIALNFIALVFASPYPFFRYLTPLIPVFMIIVALLMVSAGRVHFLVPVGMIVILVLAGTLGDFLYELSHDYDGPIEGIVKYLNDNGDKDDIVAITYGDMPLKFYTEMRIVGGLTGEDLSLAKDAKWVILRKHEMSEKDAEVRRYFMENLQRENYEIIKLNYPDIAFENREDPENHNFETVVRERRVQICKRNE